MDRLLKMPQYFLQSITETWSQPHPQLLVHLHKPGACSSSAAATLDEEQLNGVLTYVYGDTTHNLYVTQAQYEERQGQNGYIWASVGSDSINAEFFVFILDEEGFINFVKKISKDVLPEVNTVVEELRKSEHFLRGKLQLAWIPSPTSSTSPSPFASCSVVSSSSSLHRNNNSRASSASRDRGV